MVLFAFVSHLAGFEFPNPRVGGVPYMLQCPMPPSLCMALGEAVVLVVLGVRQNVKWQLW